MFKTVSLSLKLLVRRIPYILFLGFCIYALVYLCQLTFYRYAPPSAFLNIKSAVISSGQVTQPLELTFCRNARATYSGATAARSYYKLVDNKRFVAGTYSFKVDYERGDSCQIIPIPADRHPQSAGTYYAETTISFPVKFDNYTFYKDMTYRTEAFRLSDTVQGLQEQIRQLQQEIEALKAILRARGVELPSDTGVTVIPTAGGSSMAVVVPPMANTRPSVQPVVPVTPTTPSQPQEPAQPALVDVKTPLSPVLCLNLLGQVKVC